MFWKKNKKNKAPEDRINNTNYEFIINAIRELNSGDINYIYIVFCAFATSDIYLIEEAGKAIGNILKPFTESQMIKLDERFRQYTSLEWSIDWRKVTISNSKSFITDIEDWKKILILGSFHPNGYFREQCILELAKYEGTLPYLILRMNDWVDNIRELSFQLIIEKASCCSIFEILSSMEFWDKVKKSQRRGTDELDAVQNEFINKVETNIHLIKWFNLCKYSFNTRKSIYKILFAKPLLCIDEANILLEKEKSSYCKSIIISGILSSYDLPIEQLDLYMYNKNSRVRLSSLRYKYDRVKNSWSGLETMLLDNNHSIRELTTFIIKNHTSINVLNYYIDTLNGEHPAMGIIGIGENGNKLHTYLLTPFLNNKCEKTVKMALLSLSRLLGCNDNDIYWTYLFDTRISISKAAYLAIYRNKIRYGATKLFYEFNKCSLSHVRRNLLLLLMQDNSWSRLPYLLLLYNYDDIDLRNKIRERINHRNPYGRISTKEASYIKSVMKEKNGELPEALIKKIEFDLRFVES